MQNDEDCSVVLIFMCCYGCLQVLALAAVNSRQCYFGSDVCDALLNGERT